MAKSITQIQKESDDKRGVKAKSYKLKVETIEMVAQVSSELKMPQSELIDQAVKFYIESLKA